jgi:1,4-alpha-glucan branching enzyme
MVGRVTSVSGSEKTMVNEGITYWLQQDPYLSAYERHIRWRASRLQEMIELLSGGDTTLESFALGYLYFGLHYRDVQWTLREWAPNARRVVLIGDATDWQERSEYEFRPLEAGKWELQLQESKLAHGQKYRLRIYWEGGCGERIPSYANRVIQDPDTLIFNAQVWSLPEPYAWTNNDYTVRRDEPLFIYEAHVGMATERQGIGTYSEFINTVLSRVVKGGYNAIQLMAIQEHPYYGSFGYQVANFFAPSSRFGTPEELKALVDAAHNEGVAVVMDIVHSHAVKNEIEGISRFDGTLFQYFHEGPRGNHHAWDSRCFDYGKHAVLHFLLSNCRYWLDEFKFDGFRFDGVTSMLYYDHGLERAFDHYDCYFRSNVDEDAVLYLGLANSLIHDVRPDAITIAEDVSGMPGLAVPQALGGIGFDYRYAMGVPDYWIKLTKDIRDEDWDLQTLFRELNNRRADEKTISYCESHDQALVGDKTLIFRLADQEMYWHMEQHDEHYAISRALALHKMIRLITAATAGSGYMNFMGNEFGHPEWIDFPREGNGWSYHYARRQWSLVDNDLLKYRFLNTFDQEMIRLLNDHEILKGAWPRLLHEHNDDKILAFERNNVVFIFNFHPSRSFEGYWIQVPECMSYRTVFHTDAPEYGGYRRLETGFIHHAAQSQAHPSVCLYLPSRTALALAKVKRG